MCREDIYNGCERARSDTLVLEGTGNVKKGDVITAINGSPLTPKSMSSLCEDSLVTITLTSPRLRTLSAPELSPPSPPPPSTRPHKRRLLKTISTSPPPTLEGGNMSPTTYIYQRKELSTFSGINTKEREFQSASLRLMELPNHAPCSRHNSPVITAGGGRGSGKGILWSVRKAKMKITGETVCMKELQSVMESASEKAFIDEVSLLKNLKHPNLLGFRGILRSPGSFALLTGDALCPPVTPGKRRNESVGAVYWRAPEMILEKPYDHKVDIFSFGIVMCELTARIKPDPDLIRTLPDWGVNDTTIRSLAPADTPPPFLSVALSCCHALPELRPCFGKISEFLSKYRAGAMTMRKKGGARLLAANDLSAPTNNLLFDFAFLFLAIEIYF
eukprot:sb/3465551/